MTRRGLTCAATRKTPEKPLELSHLHKLLRHPYYKGIVRYRGVEYAGRHEPLVDEATWQRVQELLSSKNQSGEKQRIHDHYLKSSLFCGNRRSRMVVSINRNRYGTQYPYFVCLGRHQKRTNCTFKYTRIETVEELVTEHYRSVELTCAERELVEARLSKDFADFRNEIDVEREALDKQRQRLLREREKLLQAHYADAIPLDLLKASRNGSRTNSTTSKSDSKPHRNKKRSSTSTSPAHSSSPPTSTRRTKPQIKLTGDS